MPKCNVKRPTPVFVDACLKNISTIEESSIRNSDIRYRTMKDVGAEQRVSDLMCYR